MDESKKARLAELDQRRAGSKLNPTEEQEYQDLQRERAQRSQEDQDAQDRAKQDQGRK